MLSSGAAFLLSLCSSPLKPALLSVCLHPSSLVTLEPFSSSYLANYSSLELSSNSCVCQAAAAVRPKMGLGIWCWVTRVVEWFSGAGELICFYYPSPFPRPPPRSIHAYISTAPKENRKQWSVWKCDCLWIPSLPSARDPTVSSVSKTEQSPVF